jgi:hypothetical protein
VLISRYGRTLGAGLWWWPTRLGNLQREQDHGYREGARRQHQRLGQVGLTKKIVSTWVPSIKYPTPARNGQTPHRRILGLWRPPTSLCPPRYPPLAAEPSDSSRGRLRATATPSRNDGPQKHNVWARVPARPERGGVSREWGLLASEKSQRLSDSNAGIWRPRLGRPQEYQRPETDSAPP